MQVIVRTDASLQIGSGHVMRCLTLADELRERGEDVMFICREHPGSLIDLIMAKGYEVARLPEPAGFYVGHHDEAAHASWLGVPWQTDAAETIAVADGRQIDWLIVDHYALDRRWEEQLRQNASRIMVIDDLADRPHDCDLLLDQNLYQNMDNRYNGLVPGQCRKLFGPRYALLRPEFRIAREQLRERDGNVRRILVSFGGSDPTNETAKALQAIQILDRPLDIMVDVVVGSANPNKSEIKKFCREASYFTFHCQIENMAEIMAAADLGIGGGGATTWERCVLGLPSLTTILADNQSETSHAVAAAGATVLVGSTKNTTPGSLSGALHRLIADPAYMVRMAKQARRITGAREVWNPVIDSLLEPLYVKA